MILGRIYCLNQSQQLPSMEEDTFASAFALACDDGDEPKPKPEGNRRSAEMLKQFAINLSPHTYMVLTHSVYS